MEKSKIQAVVFILLISIAGVFWLSPFLKKGSQAKRDIGTTGYEIMDVKEITPSEDFFETQKQLEEKRQKLSWSRDPFHLSPKAAEKTGPSVEGLKLSGIAADEKGKIAIINDEIVREGDSILGIKITKITDSNVTVEKEGKSYNIEIYTE